MRWVQCWAQSLYQEASLPLHVCPGLYNRASIKGHWETRRLLQVRRLEKRSTRNPGLGPGEPHPGDRGGTDLQAHLDGARFTD